MNDEPQAPVPWLRGLALGLLIVLALGTRLPAPWRTEVLGDEMLHLESWRNHYRTSDVMPLFRTRLERHPSIPAAWKSTLLHLYHTNPLFRRVPFLVGDPPSPAFNVVSETSEILSHSSLLALRLPSVVCSLLALLVAYAIGRELWDDALGLWVAALLALGPVAQIFAGIGRPHTLSQVALFGVILMFVREQRRGYESPWRFLLVCLLAQTTHWAGWAVIGPLVVSELVRRWISEVSLGRLFRQSWWYALGSVVLLGILKLFVLVTSATAANVGYPGARTLWGYLCITSPFGHLAGFGTVGLTLSGVMFIALVALGVHTTFERDSRLREFRWPFLATLVSSAISACAMCAGTRHMLLYVPIPIVLAGIGARRLFGRPSASYAALVAVLAIGTLLSLFYTEDPYRYVLTNDARYSAVARDLRARMAPGDTWVSLPYFLAMPLYREHAFPEPAMPLNETEFHEFLQARPKDHACFAFVPIHIADGDPMLGGAVWRRTYLSGMTLVELPKEDPADMR